MLVPVIFTGTNYYLISNEKVNVKLTSHYNIIFCENSTPKNEILITLGIGEVKKQDSLYGLNFSIKYDTNKVKFESKIFLNTLSEFASFKDVTFNLEPGKIIGYFLNDEPIFGNRELIGFYGKYIGDLCNDSTKFEIEYVEFTDDYKKEINSLDTIWVKPIKYEYNNVNISLISNIDTLTYNIENKNKVSLGLELNQNLYLDVLKYNINTSSEYKISNFEINNNTFDLINYEFNNDSNNINIYVRNKQNKLSGNIKFLDFELIKKDIYKSDTSKIQISPLKLNNCNCVYNYNITGKNIYISYHIEDTTSSVDKSNDNFEIYYSSNNSILEFKNINITNHVEVQLFNYNGIIIKKEIIDYNKQFINVNLKNGIYFINIYDKNKILRKKILVYNN